jgi:hypothetical protein
MVRERFEKNAIDDREDGGIRADSNRQGENGGDRESRRFSQYAEAVL